MTDRGLAALIETLAGEIESRLPEMGRRINECIIRISDYRSGGLDDLSQAAQRVRASLSKADHTKEKRA